MNSLCITSWLTKLFIWFCNLVKELWWLNLMSKLRIATLQFTQVTAISWAWNCGANIILTLVLPFGLLSAPYIFNAVAEAVEWILVNSYKVPNLLHYLDDYISVSSPDSPQCAQNLSTPLAVCKRGAYSSTNCAGHQVGFSWVAQVACLPAVKLRILRDFIHSWLPHKWCYRQELESLIAHLHHAAQVVQPGRTLLHCMIDLLCCF